LSSSRANRPGQAELHGPHRAPGRSALYYTELLRERLRARDQTAASFFDLFNHRIISLFYQAWEKYRFPIAYERGDRDPFSHHLLDLIGLGTQGLENRQPLPDDSLIFEHLAAQSACAFGFGAPESGGGLLRRAVRGRTVHRRLVPAD
jgi:hypothetical protein